MRPTADVLQALMENSRSPLAGGFRRYQLEQEWPHVVGPQLSEQSLPVGFIKGCLYIWVAHPAMIHQLGFMKEDIKRRVNEHLGFKFVNKVTFTLDRKAALPKE